MVKRASITTRDMSTENTDFTEDPRDLSNLRLAWEHTFFAFGLIGPFGSYPHYSRHLLAPKSVLLILRSLLTIHTALLRQPVETELLQGITTCAGQLPVVLGGDPVANQTETTVSDTPNATAEQRAEIYQQISNNYFWGIGDTLGFLAGAQIATRTSSPISFEEIVPVAYKASFELLSGHSDRTRFLAWLDTDGDLSRTVSAHGPYKHHVLEYLEDEEEWSFWREWYQGFLDGKPLDWELQRRVALIPDEEWEKGPEHIARLIEEIRTRYELEKRIEELEAERQVWQERARLGVGGNNPPEAIEDDRIVQEIIWAPIEELKAETQSEAPDKSRIKSAISKLGAALIAIGKWPLGKLDKAADEFAKSLGKWGGGACAGWLALNSDKIVEIIKAAQNWLGTLF